MCVQLEASCAGHLPTFLLILSGPRYATGEVSYSCRESANLHQGCKLTSRSLMATCSPVFLATRRRQRLDRQSALRSASGTQNESRSGAAAAATHLLMASCTRPKVPCPKSLTFT